MSMFDDLHASLLPESIQVCAGEGKSASLHFSGGQRLLLHTYCAVLQGAETAAVHSKVGDIGLSSN